jgi:type I restriction enzyme S subunit
LNNFKQTDIGLIPDDWDVKKLSEASDIIMGQSPPSSTYNSNSNGLPFYQGKTDFGNIYPTPRIWCISPSKIAEKNDILISVRAPVGPTNLSFEKSGVGRGLSAIRARENHYLYIYYYLKKIEKEIEKLGTGSTFKAINKSQLYNIKIPLPPLPEQKKIAYVLSKIQQAIEIQEKIIKTTQELKKALMQKLFTEGLNGEPQKQTEIGLIPESWEVVELGNIVTKPIKDGVHQTPTYVQSGIPFITAKDIINDEISFNNCKFISFEEHDRLYQKVNPEKNDILLTKVGTIGNVAIVRDDRPFSIFVQVALIKPNHSVINPLYLKYCLLSDKIQSEILRTSGRSTMKFIGVQKIAKLLIPLPSLSEQKKISTYLELFSDLINNKLKFVESLKQLFNSMLNNLMTGQIRVKDIEFELEETAEAVD